MAPQARVGRGIIGFGQNLEGQAGGFHYAYPAGTREAVGAHHEKPVAVALIQAHQRGELSTCQVVGGAGAATQLLPLKNRQGALHPAYTLRNAAAVQVARGVIR